MKQGSEAWRLARCGSVGASDISGMLAKIAGGKPAASRAQLMARLAVERLTGRPVDTYQSAAMANGIEREPQARIAYIARGHAQGTVSECGLIPHPTINGTHASPDGLVGLDGVLEIKCPMWAAHLETIEDESAPAKYIDQMQWQLACTGRAWCDFVSYHPDFPQQLSLIVYRVERDGKRIAKLEAEVTAFLEELEAKVATLHQRMERT